MVPQHDNVKVFGIGIMRNGVVMVAVMGCVVVGSTHAAGTSVAGAGRRDSVGSLRWRTSVPAHRTAGHQLDLERECTAQAVDQEQEHIRWVAIEDHQA